MPDTDSIPLHDGPTGLGNRRALLAALRERVPAGEGAIVLLDLDGFRPISTRIGREASDKVLVEATRRLRAAAPEGAPLFRYAGDSFALLLPVGGRDEAEAAAEALRAAVASAPYGEGPQAFKLTGSAGAASFPLDGRSPAAVIESAERALLVAKHSGRNRTGVAGKLDAGKLAEIGVFRGLPCPVLVGRAEEQSRLYQLLRDVQESGPAVALLTGAPGHGKTRLAREFAAWARGEHAVVLTGTAQEERSGFPYALLADQVDGLVTADPPRILPHLEALDPAHRAALAVVLRHPPAWTGLPEIDLANYGKLVFEAFGELLEGLARGGPVVLVADEAEHGDDASFQVYGAAIAKRLPVLLLIASDASDETLDRTPAGDFVRALPAPPARIGVGPLPPEESRQVLRAILPDAEADPVQVERLVAASHGNPLYLEESVRALLLRGRIRLSGGRWKFPVLDAQDLPGSLEEAVRAVIGALPTRANSLLLRAAVLGARADSDLLSELAGQDETELLDLIDEVRRSRLLVLSDTGEDILSFPAAHARRLRLAAADPADRKEIHGRVGVVQEARHGGDVSHLADELAYHYGQAGQESKARHFGEIARRQADLLRPPIVHGTRRQRIPPVTDDLTPAALEHAHSVMRHLAGVLKVGRLYPQWSQVASQFTTQLRASLEGLLASGPGVTFTVVPGGLEINGKPAPEKVAAEFAALLEERLLGSITILSGFGFDKLDLVLRAFAEPIDRLRAGPDLWDRFLTREGLEAIDLVQKAYQAREFRRTTAMHGDTPVPEEHLPALREVVRGLKAAVDALKLYPPGHPLVEESASALVRHFAALLEHVEAVTFAATDGEFVVNGMPTDAKFFADAGQFLAREIATRELKSISVWRGLAEDEVRALVSFLSMASGEPDRAGFADRLLASLVHASIGGRSYERIEEGQAEFEMKPGPKPIRSEVRAREHLAKPYERFLGSELEQQFHLLLEALSFGQGKELAGRLVDRLGSHFHDKDLAHRTHAFQILTRAMAFASPMTRRVEVEHSASPLEKRLAEDVHPAYFRAAANVLPVWIPAAATVGCLRELSGLARKTLRPRADSDDTPPEISATCESALQLLPQSRAYDSVLAAIRRPDPAERAAALDILVAVGGPAMERLVELLGEESDPAVRKDIAKLLAPHADLVGADVARALGLANPPERVAAYLPLMEWLATPHAVGPLADLLENGGSDLRRAALQTVEKWPRPVASAVVRRLLSHPTPAHRDLGLDLASKLKMTEVSPEIGRLLEAADDESLLRLCCHYFAFCPNPAVVPQLARIAGRRPKFLGMVRGYAPATRAAAVNALFAHKGHQAEEVIAIAEKDPDLRGLLLPPKPPTIHDSP